MCNCVETIPLNFQLPMTNLKEPTTITHPPVHINQNNAMTFQISCAEI